MLVGLMTQAQERDYKRVTVVMQDYQLNGESLNFDAKYGLHTYLKKDRDWAVKKNGWYNEDINVLIEIHLIPDNVWVNYSLEAMEYIGKYYHDELVVIAGHNVLLDTSTNIWYENCTANMIVGCYSENWLEHIDNNILCTTNTVAPEWYAIIPGIYAWAKGGMVVEDTELLYAHYQNIPLVEAQRIFRDEY